MKHPDGTECNFMYPSVNSVACHNAGLKTMFCTGKLCIHQQILAQLKSLNGEEP